MSESRLQTTDISTPLASGTSLHFTNEEQIVHDYLAEHWPGFERRFHGALRSLSDRGNTERLCHAAHTLREIMSEMENHYSGPYQKLGTRMKKHVDDLKVVRKTAQNFVSGGGTEEADINAAIGYIKANEVFLQGYETEQDSLRKRVENLLIEMDPAVRGSLPGWRARLSSEWREIKGVLIGVAHGSEVTESVFLDVTKRWVAFLIARARPQTTADQESILKMIAEMENRPNANP